MSGRRWIVCGPNTRSTNGARSVMPSPSWLATQPPTPMITCGPAGLELAPAPELREHLFLRLLTHRAGVEQQQVRLRGIFGRLVIARCTQHVRHAGGVVLVHLAAEGLEVYARHRRSSCVGPDASASLRTGCRRRTAIPRRAHGSRSPRRPGPHARAHRCHPSSSRRPRRHRQRCRPVGRRASASRWR